MYYYCQSNGSFTESRSSHYYQRLQACMIWIYLKDTVSQAGKNMTFLSIMSPEGHFSLCKRGAHSRECLKKTSLCSTSEHPSKLCAPHVCIQTTLEPYCFKSSIIVIQCRPWFRAPFCCITGWGVVISFIPEMCLLQRIERLVKTTNI